MKIAIDISPIKTGNFLQHRVRGTGFYLEHLKSALLKYFPDNDYTFFSRDENLPSDVDIVHFPYFEPFFITLPSFNKTKTVVTVHDMTPLVFSDKFPSGIKGNLKWLIQKDRLKKADRIITDSESSKKDIAKYAGIAENNISVVYLAASEQFERLKTNDLRLKAAREKFDLPESFAIYVGDVTWNKNLPNIVSSFKNTNVPLFIIGKAVTEKNFDRTNFWNQDLAEVQRLIEESKDVRALGFVSDEDLSALYNLASVFVMPSFYEGFGLPVLEAMACGCPVITSHRGSLPEVAGEAAYYVEPENVEEIQKAVELLVGDKRLRMKLSNAGFEQAKKFSWKKTALETLEIYKQVLR